jgi:hypothetical protein
MRTVSFVILASMASALTVGAYAEDDVNLSGYTCAQFLTDTKNSGGALKTLLMISWATGYAAAHETDNARADDVALQLMAGVVADACRRAQEETVVHVVVNAVNSAIKTGIPIAAGQEPPKDEPQQPRSERVVGLEPSSIRGHSFYTYDNFDMTGSDTRKLVKVAHAVCATACERDRSCRAYSYDKWNKWCYLKSGTNSLTLDPSSISGVKLGTKQPVASPEIIRIDPRGSKRLVGSAYNSLKIPSLDQCSSNCRESARCLGYTFVQVTQICDLFSEVGSIAANTGARSGIKTQNPP